MTKLDRKDIKAKIWCNNPKQQVLAAAHCANACKHLLEDKRLLKAIDVALNFESYSEEKEKNLKNIYDIVNAARDATWSATWSAAYSVLWADPAANANAHAAHAATYAAIFAAATNAPWAIDCAANAIHSAAKALNDDKVIKRIIKKHLPF